MLLDTFKKNLDSTALSRPRSEQLRFNFHARDTKSPLMSSIDQYMTKPEPVTPPRPRQDPKAQLVFRPRTPQELAESYFEGSGYDGATRAVSTQRPERNSP